MSAGKQLAALTLCVLINFCQWLLPSTAQAGWEFDWNAPEYVYSCINVAPSYIFRINYNLLRVDGQPPSQDITFEFPKNNQQSYVTAPINRIGDGYDVTFSADGLEAMVRATGIWEYKALVQNSSERWAYVDCQTNVTVLATVQKTTTNGAYVGFVITGADGTPVFDTRGSWFGRQWVAYLRAPPRTSRGVPYEWLREFGITNNFEAAQDSDLTGKGMKLWEEYLAGTDPKDRGSGFRISAFAGPTADRQGSGVSISWTSYTNWIDVPFGVERCTNLADGAWQLVDGNVVRTPPMNTWTDPNPPSGAHCFYRILATNTP